MLPAPTRAISGSWGFSRNAMGEPPTKMRLAARETIVSEFSVRTCAISRRFAPDAK